MLKIAGLNVIAVVADIASINHRFFRMHSINKHKKGKITYKAPNLSQPDEFIYFVPDVPHLIKTVRNAWYNSRYNGTRHLEVSEVLDVNTEILSGLAT